MSYLSLSSLKCVSSSTVVSIDNKVLGFNARKYASAAMQLDPIIGCKTFKSSVISIVTHRNNEIY